MKIIDAAFDRWRVVVLVFFSIVLAGSVAYMAIAKESEPDDYTHFFCFYIS